MCINHVTFMTNSLIINSTGNPLQTNTENLSMSQVNILLNNKTSLQRTLKPYASFMTCTPYAFVGSPEH